MKEIGLPAQRELAEYWDVNLSTVTKAFRLCENRGILEAVVGRGTFVAHWEPDEREAGDRTGDNRTIDLGVIHPLYNQNHLLAEAIRAVSQEMGIEQYFEYDEPKRNAPIVRSGWSGFAACGFPAEPEEVCIASGSPERYGRDADVAF